MSVVLKGLKKYPLKLAAVVTMFDNGGSTGKLRKELGVPAIGDIRQCLITLSKENDFTDFFKYRFETGVLKGHNLGNLLIVAAEKLTGNLEKAINKIRKILKIEEEIIPVTFGKADIKAVLKNNKSIIGEEEIINCSYLSKIGIKKLVLTPEVKANPEAISAIKKADLIIIGPGKLYTSILPILLVKGIKEAIQKSSAKKVFICNLMTQAGNTDGFKVEDFLTVLERYLGKDVINYIIFNNGRLPESSLKKVRKVFSKTEFVKYDKNILKNIKFVGADILDHQISKLNPADILVKGQNKRTLVFHDSSKLAKIILKLCRQ